MEQRIGDSQLQLQLHLPYRSIAYLAGTDGAARRARLHSTNCSDRIFSAEAPCFGYNFRLLLPPSPDWISHVAPRSSA